MTIGMNRLALITQAIPLEVVPKNVIKPHTEKSHCKVTCVM